VKDHPVQAVAVQQVVQVVLEELQEALHQYQHQVLVVLMVVVEQPENILTINHI
jgi:hypothetical protein